MKSQERYHDYLKTDYWKAVTAKVKARADYRCQVCNSQHDLCAHHRTYEHRGHELEHLGDLICMCRRCHGIFHSKIEEPPVTHSSPPHFVVVAKKKPLKSLKRASKHQVIVRPIVPAEIDALMPQAEGDIVLTEELVDRCRINGVFTSASIRALNVPDTRAGWPFRLIGTTVKAADYRRALEGRHIYSTKGAAKLLAVFTPPT